MQCRNNDTKSSQCKLFFFQVSQLPFCFLLSIGSIHGCHDHDHDHDLDDHYLIDLFLFVSSSCDLRQWYVESKSVEVECQDIFMISLNEECIRVD